MHILILNWRDPKNPKAGGAEVVTLEHAKYWIKKGHAVSWFSSMYPGAQSEENIEGVSTFRSGSLFTVYFEAYKFYRKNHTNIDFIIDEFHGLPFFTPLYVKKPVLAYIHEIAGIIWDYMFSFPINLFGKAIEPYFFKLYTNIPFMTGSVSAKKDLIKVGIPGRNIFVVNHGVIIESVPSNIKKEKNPTYIFVNRLVKMKGIADVIYAFNEIFIKQPNAKLWIVGTGDDLYIEQIKSLVTKLHLTSAVIFWGYLSQEKKFHLLKKAHILLHASVKEGWGLNVIEAASQGTPAIVYNVAGLVDSVKNDLTGVILQKNSPGEMAKEAIKLFENKQKYNKFSKECKKWSKNFTWEKAGNESLKLIEKLYSA